MKALFSLLLVIVVWATVSWFVDSILFPSPLELSKEFRVMLHEPETYRHLLITFFRCFVGLSLALFLSLIVGVPCGFSPSAMNILSPLVAAVQSCPTIVWVSLLMVWAGVGGIVPIAALVVVAFPVVFLNVAGGTAARDRRLFDMARLYRVGGGSQLRKLLLPSLAPHLITGMSFASALSWKVISTAEFIASPTGVGSQIYSSFKLLNLPRLFCWAFILMAIGLLIETHLVIPLRKQFNGTREV